MARSGRRPLLADPPVEHSVRLDLIADVILLEEVRNSCGRALVPDATHPIEVHVPTLVFVRLFTARDDPVERPQVRAEIKRLQKRLRRHHRTAAGMRDNSSTRRK